jgi:hypothetical protein
MLPLALSTRRVLDGSYRWREPCNLALVHCQGNMATQDRDGGIEGGGGLEAGCTRSPFLGFSGY